VRVKERRGGGEIVMEGGRKDVPTTWPRSGRGNDGGEEAERGRWQHTMLSWTRTLPRWRRARRWMVKWEEGKLAALR
jgi:hypothetical protein